MTDCDDYKRLADELDGWHDCADGDVAAGNGHFRVVCESDSEQQRLNLRATLREAAETLRAASVKAGEVKVKALEWSEHKGPDGNCCYDHVTASSTIGGYSIEWKGWKDNDSYAVSRDEASVTFEYTLDTAKAAAQADYEARVRSALVVEPVKGEPVAWLRCAVEGDAPKPCNEDDDGAFPVYRAATAFPTASVGAMREALTDVATISACVAVVENPTLHVKMLANINAIATGALRALAANQSDVEALAATTAERPGTVTSEPEPSTSGSMYGDYTPVTVRASTSPSDTAPAEPVAWRYELADSREWSHGQAGEYFDWHWRLSPSKPVVPEGSIRNLTPLYAHPPRSVDMEAIARVIDPGIVIDGVEYQTPERRAAREAKARSITAMIEGE